MALLAVQTAVAAGITPTFNAASVSDTFVDDGLERTFIHVVNTGTQKILTVVPAQASANKPGVGPFTVPTMSVTIPATTGVKIVGPFPQAYINQSSGLVTVALDSATGVTIAVVNVPRTSV